MGDLVLKGATSGQITLTPTGTAGTNTLTLPAKTGNIITSADTGTVTSGMLASNVAGTGPAFLAFPTANQTITSATFTKVQLNSVASPGFNIGSYFDATTNYRFTPLIAGYYQINWVMSAFSSTSPTRALTALYKNAAVCCYGSDFVATTGYGTSSGATLIYLNGTTDYVELYAYIVASTAVISTIGTTTSYTNMSGTLVRAG